MKLNTEQQTVLDAFREFVNNDHDVFILTGSAGTGKSTLLTTMFQGVNNRAIAMGPTGRSVKVLHDKGIVDAKTIHSSIYEHPSFDNVDRETDDPDDAYMTTFSLGNLDEGIDFIFVDEASMVSDRENNSDYLKFGSGRVLADLVEFAGSRAKLVFVGDNYQLPPVGDNDSHALDGAYLAENFGLSVEGFELKQIQRQAEDSGILQNATKIRDLIDTPTNQRGAFEFDYHNDDVFEVTNKDVTERDAATLRNGIVITYENKRAYEYNQQIRQKIFGEQLMANGGRIMPGEKIIFSKNIYRSDLYDQEILNGDTATVINVSNDSVVHPVKYQNETWQLKFRKITFKTNNVDHVETAYIYENFLYEPDSNFTPLENQLFYIDLMNRTKQNSENYAKYQSAMADYKQRADKYHSIMKEWGKYVPNKYPTKKEFERRAREYYQFGRNYKPTLAQYGISELVQDLRTSDPFLNAIVAKFGYAVTGHKSQGGEWDTAFVDYSSQNNNSDSALRWTYTATTRSKRELYVINPPKFSSFDKLTINGITQFSKLKSFEAQQYQPSDTLMNDLYQLVAPIIQNNGYTIKYVEEEINNYYVRYYLTSDDGAARLQFYFNSKGISKCLPSSTQGSADTKLAQIIDDINATIKE